MDKKKIKELIEKAIFYMNEGAIYTSEITLNEALKELSKSDWISVEDELPPYGESVLTTNENDPDVVIKTSRKECEGCNIDKNGFLDYFEVTHWKHIEKLGE